MRNGSLPVVGSIVLGNTYRPRTDLIAENMALRNRIRILENQVRSLKEQLSGAPGYLRCSICHATKPESEFWRDRSYQATGHRTSCKTCERAKGSRWSVQSSE